MVSKQKILIVDDDNNIAELIALYLTKECFETMIVNDGESALSAVDSFAPNLILLDLMLPGIDGYQVCREVRAKSSIPIIMLSAKGEIFDKVLGLELGADDYMTKPFGVMELISRVKALLRRMELLERSEEFFFEGIRMEEDRRQVTVDGEPVELTYKEYELLKVLLHNSGIVLPRGRLLERVWGIDYEGETRTLDVHIKTLRHKLGKKGALIQTVRNVGYTLNYARPDAP